MKENEKIFMKHIFSIMFILLLTLCSIANAADTAQKESRRITVAGAADLSFALQEISADFEKETNIKVVLTFGSTGMLARQIENGAPYDVFMAADTAVIKELDDRGLTVAGTSGVYAVGALAIVSNIGSKVAVSELKDLLKPEVRWVSIAQPLHAPYGRAAMEALKNAGIWSTVKHKLVYGENIRQALTYVQTGDATAGIVALSVADVPEVTYVRVPPVLHNPVNQSACVLAISKDKDAAKQFLAFVKGPVGAITLKKYQFMVPDSVH